MDRKKKIAFLANFLRKKLNEIKKVKDLEFSHSEKHFFNAYEILRRVEPSHALYYYNKYLEWKNGRS